MNEIAENGIRIYSGEMDEDDDSSEIRDLKVTTLLMLTPIPII